MSRASDSQLPDWLTSRSYRCDTCGEEAGQLELQFFRGYDDVTLIIDGVVGQTTTWLTEENAAYLEKAMQSGSPSALFEIDNELASFFCPDCGRIYCAKHWRTEIVFDDDPAMPGWYDCTYGTCPAGHRRIIDD